MKLMRLSKKIARATTLGENCHMDISWASGPGYRGGPENYFSLRIEGAAMDLLMEFDVEEAKRIKEQLDDFLQHIERGKPWWETGEYFSKVKAKRVRKV
jgi:hypothetical protein